MGLRSSYLCGVDPSGLRDLEHLSGLGVVTI